LALIIPKGLADEMEMDVGTEVDVTAVRGGLTVRRRGRRARRSTAEVVAGMKASNYRRKLHMSLDTAPVGKEIW
jgi:antitoxin component of MazEF toxin-antitoxin module